jgi:hypothetical protein
MKFPRGFAALARANKALRSEIDRILSLHASIRRDRARLATERPDLLTLSVHARTARRLEARSYGSGVHILDGSAAREFTRFAVGGVRETRIETDKGYHNPTGKGSQLRDVIHTVHVPYRAASVYLRFGAKIKYRRTVRSLPSIVQIGPPYGYLDGGPAESPPRIVFRRIYPQN